MNFCGVEIRTPFLTLGDDPVGYQRDWRHQVAAAIAGSAKKPKMPNEFKDDKWIAAEAEYLKELAKGTPNLFKKYAYHCVASAWENSLHGTQVKTYIQPALLSTGTIEWISKELGVPPELVQLYERLYFAVRDENGKPISAGLVTQVAAYGAQLEVTPDSPVDLRWRADAVKPQGKVILSAKWSLDKTEEKTLAELKTHNAQLAESLLQERILAGHMSNEDAIALVTQDVEQQKFEHDTSQEKSDSEAWDLLFKVLQLAKPPKPVINLSAEEVDAQNTAVQQRWAAEKNIKKTEIVDNGPAASSKALTTHLQQEAKQVKTSKKGDKK